MFSSLLRNTTTRRSTAAVARRLMSTEVSHKPLIDVHGLHARYANATYIAASKSNALDKVEGELLALQATASSNAAFADFLHNPLISRTQKVAQVEEWLGGKASPTTLNLMTTLAGNARLSELSKIVNTYSQFMKAHRGQVEATITSAEELTKAQLDAISKAMKASVGKGKTVSFDQKVDPTILGGLQIQVGDQFLDLSVSSKIDSISRTVV